MMEQMLHFELLARRLMGEIPRYILINQYDVSVKKDNAGEIISLAKAPTRC